MKKIFSGALLTLMSLVLLTACIKSDPVDAPDTDDAAIEESDSSVTEEEKVEVVKKITVVGKEFAYEPSVLDLKVGEKVELTFKNEGKYPHDLDIPALSVNTEVIPAGKETTVIFMPEKSGSYELFCSVAGHKDLGMKGSVEAK